MRTKPKRKSRLTRELLETAKGMRAGGVIDNATYDKITMRHWDGDARVLPCRDGVQRLAFGVDVYTSLTYTHA